MKKKSSLKLRVISKNNFLARNTTKVSCSRAGNKDNSIIRDSMAENIAEKLAERCFFNMAIDEALLECSGLPCLRLYAWKPKAVSIGYFQSAKDELNFLECKKNRVDIVRRITGGGAVFHDKELTYSFVCDEKLISKSITKSYEKICSAISISLSKIGIKAKFSPVNDILAYDTKKKQWKKISGSAQTRRNKRILQHGTILLGLDKKLMFRLLKVPSEKLSYKRFTKSVEDRVCSVESITGEKARDKIIRKLISSLIGEFSKLISAKEIIYTGYTEEELSLAGRFSEKFRAKSWTLKR